MLALLSSVILLTVHPYPAAGGSIYGTLLPFDDIEASYAKEQIVRLFNHNVISGTGFRTFEPAKPITRAEFVTMVSRLLGLKPVPNDIPAFGDVPRDAWFYGWVQAGINLNIVQGTSPYGFEPDKLITRQEAATMIVRAMKRQAQAAAASVSPTDLPYNDKNSVAAWAVPYVRLAAQLGLMTGDAGQFRPSAPMTRQETAVVFDRVLQNASWSNQLQSVPKPSIQIGWQYAETTEQFIERVKQSTINTAVPRWFYIEADGSVSNQADPSLVEWAAGSNVQVWAMLGNHSNDEWTDYVLSDKARRDAVIKQVAHYALQYGFSGINLDFENVKPENRSVFTTFVTDLAAALHATGRKLSVDVSPDTGTDWTDAFDYQALGQAADYVVLMGYDEHWNASPIAGSVSSLPWLRRSLDNLLADVKPAKIIAALPFYTRDWTLGATVQSEDLTLVEQGERIERRQAVSQWNSALAQYEANYSWGGASHRIWTEDSRSLSQKYAMGAERGIAGFAYWFIDAETTDVWAALSNASKYASYNF